MAIDGERERSGVPMNDRRRTTKVVCRIWVNVVLCIETLLVWLVWVSYRTRRKSSAFAREEGTRGKRTGR
jgi:hypothetical protein